MRNTNNSDSNYNTNNHSSSSSNTSSNNTKYLWSACCRFSCSSPSTTLLLVVIIPLVAVSGLVCVLGPKSTNWALVSSYASDNSTSSVEASLKNNNSNYNESSSSMSNNNNNINVNGVMGLRSNMIQSNIEEAISDESMVNRSSTPPLAVQVQALSHTQHNPELNGTQKSGFDNSVNESEIGIPSTNNETNIPLLRAKRKREFTHLERLEGRLMKARSAIIEAKIKDQTRDLEYVPTGPMYWNSKAFHRSYLEMEKEFKVFVYEEGEPPLFHNGPCKSIYSMEGNFIHELEMNSHFRTKDPHKAHAFFLPFSVTMLVRYVYVRDSHDFSPIKNTVVDYVNLISQKYPFWNRSLAADHFMLSCHDWGPEASRSNPNLHKNSIRVLCNANTSEGFNPSKDVSFPEINLMGGTTDKLLGGPSASRRPILAFFAGGVHGPIRPVLLDHWENKGDEDMSIQKYLPKGVSYYDMLRKSKYCLCPSGYEVASPRVVEAIYTGCVPVLISDHYVPPFSDVLNWKSFSVEVSVKDIPRLKEILTSISSTQYIRMQRRVLTVRRHFEVNSPPKRFDVFHMILHSVWLRRLNIRIPEDQ